MSDSIAKLYDMKVTLSDGTVLDAGQIEIPKGADGEPGKGALVCAYVNNVGVDPKIGNDITIAPVNEGDWSRTPEVGDIVTIVWKQPTTGATYDCICTIKTSNDSMVIATIKNLYQTGGASAAYATDDEINALFTSSQVQVPTITQETNSAGGTTYNIDLG